ncbi:MAG: type II toxin-antitoxin system HicB family antitoxin [Dehalococcoidia bacterium]
MEDREYLAVVEEAGDNFSAFLPDVPGCIATGATVDETLAELRSALKFHLDGMKLAGLPIPKPRTRAARVTAGV